MSMQTGARALGYRSRRDHQHHAAQRELRQAAASAFGAGLGTGLGGVRFERVGRMRGMGICLFVDGYHLFAAF